MKWLPLTSVKGYERYDGYFVTDTGEVWSKKKDEMIQLKPYNAGPYQKVWIYGKYKKENTAIGRIVASAFIEKPPNAKMIRYKDKNPRNCNVDNLEWIVPKPKWKKPKTVKKKPKKRKRRPKKRGPKPKRLTKRTIIRERSKYYVKKNSIVIGLQLFSRIENIKKALELKTGQGIEIKTIIDEILESALNEFIDRKGLKRIIYQLENN